MVVVRDQHLVQHKLDLLGCCFYMNSIYGCALSTRNLNRNNHYMLLCRLLRQIELLWCTDLL